MQSPAYSHLSWVVCPSHQVQQSPWQPGTHTHTAILSLWHLQNPVNDWPCPLCSIFALRYNWSVGSTTWTPDFLLIIKLFESFIVPIFKWTLGCSGFDAVKIRTLPHYKRRGKFLLMQYSTTILTLTVYIIHNYWRPVCCFMTLPCIPLVRAGVIFIGGLEVDRPLDKANKHGLLIHLPLELRTSCSR